MKHIQQILASLPCIQDSYLDGNVNDHQLNHEASINTINPNTSDIIDLAQHHHDHIKNWEKDSDPSQEPKTSETSETQDIQETNG